MATLDTWKNKDSIPEKYIHWHEKVSGHTQTQVSATEHIALELAKIPDKTPEQAVEHYKTILKLLQQ